MSTRRRRNAEQRRDMVNQWRASGLSKAQFAKDAQVSPNTLRRWVHEQSEESAFVEVVAAHAPALWVEVGCVRVQVPTGFDSVELRRLVQALC